MTEQLTKEQYESESDVRASVSVAQHIAVIYGESGQGKTWSLARLASESADGGALVIWVPASRGTIDPSQYAAREICDYGLESDVELTLERIAVQCQDWSPDKDAPWAVICVDGVTSQKELESLLHLDWRRWGMSLVISTSSGVARSISLAKSVPSYPLQDFDYSELRTYLTRRGVSWVGIANDVRRLIRRPILSKIYADVVSDPSKFTPRNEYELIEASWLQLTSPTEVAAVRRMAGSISNDATPYPWLADTLLDEGLTNEMMHALIERGWLHDLGEGRVEMWHQRFLCWAYAKYLAAKFVSGELSFEELSDATLKCYRLRDPRRINLGYVPMDLFWILLDPSTPGHKSKELWRLLAQLETHNGLGHQDEELYRHLIASLGERAISVLLDRVHEIEDLERSGVVARVSEALKIIGEDHRDRISVIARECLGKDDEAFKSLGLSLAVTFPDKVNVERVWQDFRDCILADENGRSYYLHRRRSSAAFASVAACNKDWFTGQLQAGDVDDPCFTCLVFALANMRTEEARLIWHETKHRLIETIRPEKRRCLVACIVCFNDTEEYQKLVEWTNSENDFIGPVSTQGLAYRDPNLAFPVLKNVPKSLLGMFAKAIGTALAASDSQRLSKAVIGLTADTNDPGDYFELFESHGDCLKPPLAEAILNWLEELLDRHADIEESKNSGHLWHALRFVENLHGGVMLAALRTRRNSKLEKLLLTFALSRIGKISDWVDREFNQSRELLKRIAGEGFTDLTNALILAEHDQLRMEGCELAVIRPNDETRRLLKAECVSERMWESGSTKINLVQMQAVDSLAALGENDGVVLGLLKWGLDLSPYIGDLREGKGEMSDMELMPALKVLEDSSHPDYPKAMLAIGISGRQDLRKLVEDHLLASDVKSVLAQCCLIALEDLPSDGNRVFDRLVEQYRSGIHKHFVLRALSGCEIPTERYLRLLPTEGSFDETDQRVIQFLAADESTRSAVRSYVEKLLAAGTSSMTDVVALLNPGEDQHQKLLWEKTLGSNSGVHIMGSRARAIRALGEVDPDAAIEIGLETLISDGRDRTAVSQVLLELNPQRTVGELCRVASESNDRIACCAIARALRSVRDESLLDDAVVALLNDEEWKKRRVAAFIAGFLPSNVAKLDLQRKAYSDQEWDVCATAQAAIRSRQREREAIRLIQTLGSLASSEVWGTLDSILQLVDPGIATASNDPLGFIEVLRKQPYVVRKYVSESVTKRRKKVEEKMKSLHEKWKDDE
ncbi:hypothetical protein [Rosistilla oblonga]|uniref:hypothetical protein n=1 Tax=Rosistilla oblonga TaxID=2527990 RepID=UPI003A9762E7